MAGRVGGACAAGLLFLDLVNPLGTSGQAIPPRLKIIPSLEKGWPQFRGPGRDGMSEEKGLLAARPEAGPKMLWSTENLGRGYSSPILAGGRIYLTGDVGDELHVFSLDLDGKLVWQAKNGAAWKGQYPAARASIAYSDGMLYHENSHGRVACLDATSGREVWAIQLLETFGGQNITWGMSECLLVDDRAVYATAGGMEALLLALDKTGSLLWKSPPLIDSEGDGSADSAVTLLQFSRNLPVGG